MDPKEMTQLCEPCLLSARDKDHVPSAYLIVLRGSVPGTMLRVREGKSSLGRSSENTFSFYDHTISRNHAVFQMGDGGRVSLLDRGSTNGTFVNGTRVAPHSVARLRDGDEVQLGTDLVLKLVRLSPSEERFQLEMFERTVRDAMTGLYNRAYFLDQILPLAGRYAAEGSGLSILMLDIDHFKQINDGFGHLAGDCVLREVGRVIRESTRSQDLVARYGGEEFVAALPVSAADLAIERAERIRLALAGREVPFNGRLVPVTVSIGLAFAPPGRPHHALALIGAADEALYQAKAGGRNRVVLGRASSARSIQETQSAEFLTYL